MKKSAKKGKFQIMLKEVLKTCEKWYKADKTTRNKRPNDCILQMFIRIVGSPLKLDKKKFLYHQSWSSTLKVQLEQLK